MTNPFFCSGSVPSHLFVDRRRELRRITGRVASHGQSVAIIGEPRTGKTSLLRFLELPEVWRSCSVDEECLVFSYLDAQTLGIQFGQTDFWDYALRPLCNRAIIPFPDSPLALCYKTCQEDAFGTYVLERLFAQMESIGWHLVLLLDEFDVLLNHPVLYSGQFLGSLRSLASRYTTLSLITACRRPLASLNHDTQQLSLTGSPYFNFLHEINLGPLPDNAVDELLHRGENQFTVDERHFIERMAGGHPYLVQTAAASLWDAYEDGEENAERRKQQVSQQLYSVTAQTLRETWKLWSPKTRKAFVAAALAHIIALKSKGGYLHLSEYNIAAIRKLLRAAFMDKELRRFCQDRPAFCPALTQIGGNGSQEEIIDALIDYCQARVLFSELLSEVQSFNPRNYQRYESQLAPQYLLDLINFRPQLQLLSTRGCVVEDQTITGGWLVHPPAFLWWLICELMEASRSEDSLDEWLQVEAVDIALTREEKRHLGEIARAIRDSFEGDVAEVISAIIEKF